MNEFDLTVTRSPTQVAALLDRLSNAPLGAVLTAMGLQPLELHRVGERAFAFAGDAPHSLVAHYEREPLITPFDVTRTCVRISAHDAEGRILAALLQVALSA